MGRIVVSEFVSLDGVMEDPGGSEGTPSGGWAFRFERGADGDTYKLEELQDAEAMLLGRVTYQGFAAAWPSITDEQGFAEKMNGMPKYVVSSTLEQADWQNSTILPGDPVAEICMAVGLRSVGSFTTSFGRTYGLSPTAYRAAHPPAANRVPVPGCLALAWARKPSSTFREDAVLAVG